MQKLSQKFFSGKHRDIFSEYPGRVFNTENQHFSFRNIANDCGDFLTLFNNLVTNSGH